MRLLRGFLFGLALAATLTAPAQAQEAAPTAALDIKFMSGLICDTQEQAERFVLVLADNVEKALGTVNNEAGVANACMMATFGFVPGETVSEVERKGAIVKVVEVVVTAVAANGGLQMLEPTQPTRPIAECQGVGKAGSASGDVT